jgi:hypothetical protein
VGGAKHRSVIRIACLQMKKGKSIQGALAMRGYELPIALNSQSLMSVPKANDSKFYRLAD